MNDKYHDLRIRYLYMLGYVLDEAWRSDLPRQARNHLECALWHMEHARAIEIPEYKMLIGDVHPAPYLVHKIDVGSELRDEAQAIRDWMKLRTKEAEQIVASMKAIARDYDNLILNRGNVGEEGSEIICSNCEEDWTPRSLAEKWGVDEQTALYYMDELATCPSCENENEKRPGTVTYLSCPKCHSSFVSNELTERYGPRLVDILAKFLHDGCPKCGDDERWLDEETRTADGLPIGVPIIICPKCKKHWIIEAMASYARVRSANEAVKRMKQKGMCPVCEGEVNSEVD